MSFLSWFSRKSPPAAADRTPIAVPPGHEPTVPYGNYVRPSRPNQQAVVQEQTNNRKNERMERRELLYTVVRDAMVRAGVLSASYKFKVLSLDQRGSQFLVMMDVAREFGGEPGRLSEIETLIAQTAKSRYGIAVTAVYWRINDQIAAGVPLRAVAAPTATSAIPLPVASLRSAGQAPAAPAVPAAAYRASSAVRDSALGELASEEHAASPVTASEAAVASAFARTPVSAPKQAFRASPSVFDPIEADEVAAFRKALGNAAAASSPSSRKTASRSGTGRQSATEDFADTEMTGHSAPGPDLGVTQYGDL